MWVSVNKLTDKTIYVTSRSGILVSSRHEFLVHIRCGDVIISTKTMVVSTTPYCRYEKHCHYVMFCITILYDGVFFSGLFL